jgi:DNA-binding response OmpR family regulator
MKPRILVIDDESAIRDSLKMILEYEGFDVHGAATGQDGLTLADREPADLVLLDIKMAGMDGLTSCSGSARPTRRCPSS